MATKNNITGDSLITKASSDAYRNNWDAIFSKNKIKVEEQEDLPKDMENVLADNLNDLYEEQVSENVNRVYPLNCTRIYCICCRIISWNDDGSNSNIICLVAHCYWDSNRDDYGACTYNL